MSKSNVWALIKDGIVANIIVWDWDGSKSSDLYREYQKQIIDDAYVGVGFIAEKVDGGDWVFKPGLE